MSYAEKLIIIKNLSHFIYLSLKHRKWKIMFLRLLYYVYLLCSGILILLCSQNYLPPSALYYDTFNFDMRFMCAPGMWVLIKTANIAPLRLKVLLPMKATKKLCLVQPYWYSIRIPSLLFCNLFVSFEQLWLFKYSQLITDSNECLPFFYFS